MWIEDFWLIVLMWRRISGLLLLILYLVILEVIVFVLDVIICLLFFVVGLVINNWFVFIFKVRINIVIFFGEGGIYVVFIDKYKFFVVVGGVIVLVVGVYIIRLEVFVLFFIIVFVLIIMEVGL